MHPFKRFNSRCLAGYPPVSPLSSLPRRRVLVLAPRLPYPPDRGDRIRSFHFLQRLAREQEVSLACFAERQVDFADIAEVRQKVRRLYVGEMNARKRNGRAVRALALREAVSPSVFADVKIIDQVRLWHRQQPFDVMLTLGSTMAGVAAAVMAMPQPPVHLLDLCDVDSEKWRQLAEVMHGWRHWLYRREAGALQPWEAGERCRVDGMLVISEQEAQIYRRLYGPDMPLHVVGNGVDAAYFTPMRMPESSRGLQLLFTGVLDYEPNVQGLCWFVQNVFPALRRSVSEMAVTLNIVGRSPSRAVRRLGRVSGVRVIGPVDDVRPWLAQASVVVAPLHIAPGVQNKVLQAMACQRPVVCSPQAALGIDAQPGRDLVVASFPEQWVQVLEHLLRNETHRTQIAQSARLCVQQRYAWETQTARLSQCMQKASHHPVGQRDAA